MNTVERLEIKDRKTFKNVADVRFRIAMPNDIKGMYQFFNCLSSETIYNRFFTYIKPISKDYIRQYMILDYSRASSIIGLLAEPSGERIIAEARFVKNSKNLSAEFALVVDEQYQKLGIGTYIYNLLIKMAKSGGVNSLIAEVLPYNSKVLTIVKMKGWKVKWNLTNRIYQLIIPIEEIDYRKY
jgi:GNAT superfamily N-acetyltransferase